MNRFFLLVLCLQILSRSIVNANSFISVTPCQVSSFPDTDLNNSIGFSINNRILIDLIAESGDPLCYERPRYLEQKRYGCGNSNNLITFNPIYKTEYYGTIQNVALMLDIKFEFEFVNNQVSFKTPIGGDFGFQPCSGAIDDPSECIRYLTGDDWLFEIYFEILENGGPYQVVTFNILFNSSYCSGEYNVGLAQCIDVGFHNDNVSRDSCENLIKYIEKKQVSVYPNPFHSNLNIEISGAKMQEEILVVIYDVKGGAVFRSIVKNLSSSSSFIFNIETEDLPTGILFYSLTSDNISQQGILFSQ